MAWWQKKILKYALSRTGLLDDEAVDLDKLDITLGKRNVVELKDVGLNIVRLTKLAQLPPELRIEVARVLTLRLTLPADIYQSSIIVEADGVRVDLRLEVQSDADSPIGDRNQHARAPTTTHSPSHRKVPRRLEPPSPPHHGYPTEYNEAHIPTTEELAASFLHEEPVYERRELEASVAANSKNLEESLHSLSSDGDEVGTGASVGLPGFLAGFLQGIVDRLQVQVRNVEIKMQTETLGAGLQKMPVGLKFSIAHIELGSMSATETSSSESHSGRRRLELRSLSLNILSEASIFAEMSELPSRSSPEQSRSSESYTSTTEHGVKSTRSMQMTSSSSSAIRSQLVATKSVEDDVQSTENEMRASIATADTDRFADAGEDGLASSARSDESDLHIQPGDDNISWGSRRSKSEAPVEDLWRSMTSEEDLPDSLLFESTMPNKNDASQSSDTRSLRTRHDVSPYDRILQSPGSWPHARTPSASRPPSIALGSLPKLDLVDEKASALATPGPVGVADEATDNKQKALDHSVMDELDTDTPNEQMQDITSSRFFSHEDAESMYMSAMAHSPTMHVPGGWDAQSHPRSPTSITGQLQPELDHSMEENIEARSSSRQSNKSCDSTGHATPRAQSPEASREHRHTNEITPTMLEDSRQVLSVDLITMWFSSGTRQADATKFSSPQVEAPAGTKSFFGADMPGTFSAYSELSASRRNPTSAFRERNSNEPVMTHPNARAEASTMSCDIDIHNIRCHLDLSSGRLLFNVVTQANTVLSALGPPPSQKRPTPSTNNASTNLNISLSIKAVNFVLATSLGRSLPVSDAQDSSPNDVLTIKCHDIHTRYCSDEQELRVGSGKLFFGTHDLASFDRTSSIKSSIAAFEETPDIYLKIKNTITGQRRATREILLETLPLKLLIDTQVVEASLDSFGGLSGILDISNSLLSESGCARSPRIDAKPQKGVRFESDPSEIHSGVETKINCSIGGVNCTLRARACSLRINSSTIKIVHREAGAMASVEHFQLRGPCMSNEESPPAAALNLESIRIEYLLTPQDKDLERLLSLLTPSKDKYDSDEDILIDTLLRQRKKGAVLRVSAAGLKVHCGDLTEASILTQLGAELSKISAVSKYLPEDQRPGLLSLVRIRDIEGDLKINERFGKLQVNLQDLHCAHVGLPALFAFSLGEMRAMRESNANLIMHPLNESETLPMVMARMLGDEIEPTVKVKLLNVCAEYSVETVLDLTNLDAEVVAEEVVAELANTIAGLNMKQEEEDFRDASPASDASERRARRVSLDLLLHDCGIGLKPTIGTSKGLLILSDARICALVPPANNLSASLDLRKAGLFMADEVIRESANSLPPSRSAPRNSAVKPKLTLSLAQHGFVSVGSVMAAKVKLSVQEDLSGSRLIDVNIGSELLLLETCADSTQTLNSVFGGLAPPTPPSKQPKYLTEPMTIEDLMASFTAEPEPLQKSSRPPETLFDAEDPEAAFEMPMLDEDEDGLLAESDMASSLYGPVSGILAGIDAPHDEDGSENFAETAESLLEDDPFEMTDSPVDPVLSDNALLRELNKQRKPAVSDEAVDLGLYEIDDLGFDALDPSNRALGSHNRFNTPAVNKRAMPSLSKQQTVPLRVKLRDLHVIWNLYDGYDWQRTRDTISEIVEQVETKIEERKARRRQSRNDDNDEESVIGDFLFNSIYIGVPSNTEVQDLRRQINRGIDDLASETESVPVSGMSRPTNAFAGGPSARQRPRRRLKLERSKVHKIAFEMKGVSADVVGFPSDCADIVSSVDVRVKDFDIFDNVPTSTWRKFLTSNESHPGDREMSKPMLHLEILDVRTLEQYAATELVMHVSVLPLRLHVDQDALDFITRFFEFKDKAAEVSAPPSEQPFLQRVEVDTVDLCLDYKPKKVDYIGLRSGHTNEFMNFVILDAANIRLRHAIIYGIKGFEPLHKTLNDVWMPDVKRNQLPTVLAGLAPVRSLVNIGTGVRDVIAIPVHEYRKDGRVVRSIQKGAFNFGKTTASELARLGAKVAMGTQNLLQGAEGFLAPSSSIQTGPPRPSSGVDFANVGGDDDPDREPRAISAYANQPLGVLSGLRSARRYLEHDLLTARDALIAVQGEVMDGGTPGSAAVAVARHAPTIVLRPVIGASRAVGTALLGVGNQIDRENLRKVENKYKRQ